MSLNNTIIEDDINSNINPKTISQNCDTEFLNGEETNYNFNDYISIKNVWSTDLREAEFNNYIYDGKVLKKVVKSPKIAPKLLPNEPEISQDTVLTKTLREIAAQKEKTLLKIAANQERAEERRHQETLSLIRELGNVLIKRRGLKRLPWGIPEGMLFSTEAEL